MSARHVFALAVLALAPGSGPLRADDATNDVASATNEAVRGNTAPLVGTLLAAGTGALILAGHESKEDASAEDSGLGVPEPENPPDGAELPGTARQVTLAWRAVEGAGHYLLDVDACDTNGACADLAMQVIPATSRPVDIPAAPSARWRVRAVQTNGVAGPFSAFATFRFVDAP